jgi:ceramide glucosyltransferase
MAGWILIPIAYQVLVIAAWIAFRMRKPAPQPVHWPGVSILKPTAPGAPVPEAAARSHLDQNYPEFELIHQDGDGAPTPNRKVGKLMELARAASHEIWIINDADIRVPPGYLKAVIAELLRPGVGVVTCLYRARGDSPASRWESVGVAVDFMPSVLVARLLGVREFGLGATLAFRREDLERAGGLEAIAPYLADDYQLAKHIVGLGLRCELAPVIVETSLHGDWAAVWRHQVRWARTIRFAKGAGYWGLPVTHSGIWALGALLAGFPTEALTIAAMRVLAASTSSPWALLAPLWDLFAFAVWIAGLVGSTVEWGGNRLSLDREGRIFSREAKANSVTGR